MSEAEEAQIREIPEEAPVRDEGQSVVRLQRRRRLWPLLLLLPLLLILVVVLASGPSLEEGVSLRSAGQVLVQKNPPWQKSAMLGTLRAEGYRATPGPPRSPLEVTVSLRRDGILLRSESDRLWIVRAEFPKK